MTREEQLEKVLIELLKTNDNLSQLLLNKDKLAGPNISTLFGVPLNVIATLLEKVRYCAVCDASITFVNGAEEHELKDSRWVCSNLCHDKIKENIYLQALK